MWHGVPHKLEGVDEPKLLKEIVDADDRILDEPAVTIAVSELADSSVNFAVRVWAATGDYWGIYFDLTENVKKRFDEVGISWRCMEILA